MIIIYILFQIYFHPKTTQFPNDLSIYVFILYAHHKQTYCPSQLTMKRS